MKRLRLDPAHVPLWRDATTLQLGREGTVVLHDPAPWQERVLAELERGAEAGRLTQIAAAGHAPEGALAELLRELAPVLRTEHARRSLAVFAADGFPERAVADVLDGLEAIGWDPVWTAPGEQAALVRDGRMRPLPVVLLAAHAVPPHLWTALQRTDVPHLPVVFAGDSAEIGPLVRPGVTACLSCLASHESERDPAWPALVTQLLARRPGDVPLPLAVEAASLAARLLDDDAEADRHADGRSRSVRIGGGSRRLWRSHRPHEGCLCRLATSRDRRSPRGTATAAAPPAPSLAPTTATAFARPA